MRKIMLAVHALFAVTCAYAQEPLAKVPPSRAFLPRFDFAPYDLIYIYTCVRFCRFAPLHAQGVFPDKVSYPQLCSLFARFQAG